MEDPRAEVGLTMNEEGKQMITDARKLYNKGEYAQAITIGKAVAFDGLYTHDFDLVRLSYLLLADIDGDDEDREFGFLQGALQASEFNGPLHVRTCYHLVYRMLAMDTPKVLRFISYIMSAVRSPEFLAFLIALQAKLTNKQYSTLNIPDPLVLELSRFRYKEAKPVSISASIY